MDSQDPVNRVLESLAAPRPTQLRTISLHQPWATLVAIGAKRIETRSWKTDYRGPLCIHAAKRWKPNDIHTMFNDSYGFWRAAFSAFEGYFQQNKIWTSAKLKSLMPLGKLVATCRLVDCIPVEKVSWELLQRTVGTHEGRACCEAQLGNYNRGRYAWLLEDIREIPGPIPYRGHQSFFSVPFFTVDEILAERKRQVEKGFDDDHDDTHKYEEIASAADCYLLAAQHPHYGRFGNGGRGVPSGWPWEEHTWAPNDQSVPCMVKAGALYMAEEARLNRIAAKEP